MNRANIILFRISLAVVCLSGLAAIPVWACGPVAGSSSPCGTASPAAAPVAVPSTGVGNPIDVVTGNKYQYDVDMAPLPGVLGLQWDRHYNSRTPHLGALGAGWNHAYEALLHRGKDGAIKILQADGRLISFVPNRDHVFYPAAPTDGRVEVIDQLFRWTWNDGRRLEFDLTGHLVSIQMITGDAVFLSYDRLGRLLQISDPQKRTLSFGYDNTAPDPVRRNLIRSVSGPLGRYSYRYDRLNNLVQVVYPDRTVRRYRYEDRRNPHSLTGIVDRSGVRYATFAYDGENRAILSTHAGGTGKVTLRFEHAPSDDGRQAGRTVLTNSLGNQTVYETRIENRIPVILSSSGIGCATCGPTHVSYQYNARTQLVAETLGGVTTRTLYDPAGRVIQVTRASRGGKPGLVARYTYGESIDEPTLIERPSVAPGQYASIRIRYDTFRHPLEITENGYTPDGVPLRRTTQFSYDDRGRLSAEDGPLPGNPDTTRYRYDEQGRLEQITAPGNLVSRVEAWDEAGRPLAVRATDGVLTRMQYDLDSQVTRIERAGRVVRIRYDGRGLPTMMQGNDGQILRIAYQPESGSVRYILPDGQILDEHYNTESQLVSVGWLDQQGRALGDPARYQYDPQTDQLAGITLPSGLQAAFSLADRSMHWTEGSASGSTRFDPQARLLETHIADARFRAQTNAQGSELALTLPTGAVHTQVMDDFGRVLRQTGPERGLRTAVYDLADRTIEVRDALRVMTARYDAAGHLIERRHRDLTDHRERVVHYTWQGTRLVRIDDPAQGTAYAYDAYGRVTGERVTIKSGNGTTQRSYLTRLRYDRLGRQVGETLPEGATLTYRYDAIGRVNRIDYQAPAYSWWVKAIRRIWADYGSAPLIADIQTDSAHGLLGFTHANGEIARAQYDPARRLTGWTDGDADTRLAYNADEEIAQLTRNGQRLDLAYDTQGRLRAVKDTAHTRHYVLDANGNRLDERVNHQPAEVFRYRPASDQLLAAAAQRYRYNAVGEPVQIQTGPQRRQFAYGPMGELAAVYDNGKQVAGYRYNQDLQRIAKTVDGRSTFYLWKGGLISAEADAQGNILTRYFYLGTRPVAMIRYASGKPTLYSLLTDHLGTPLRVTDAHRRTVWQAEYDVYGRITVSNHSLHSGASPPEHAHGWGISEAQASIPATAMAFNLRLPGQYEDTETGLYYNWHRYYDPGTGRYLTPDPIGLEGGSNVYGYVGGNPLSFSDPLGLYPAVMVTLPNGTTYIPMTTVKNPAQAAAYGLPVGTPTAIAIPPGANPQGDVNSWACAKDKGFGAFKKYWADPSHNYKVANGPMYDAYGNFQYGATGEAAGFPLWILQGAAEYLHNWNNNPINTNDINSGFNAINAGGKLSVTNYNPAATGSN